MDYKRKHRGVYARGGILWISYSTPAGRVRQSTGLPDTAANRRRAADLVAAARITGSGAQRQAPTFGTYAREWLTGQSHLAKSTWESYRQILNAHWLPQLHGQPIDRITGTDLASILADIPWRSPKTRNNAVTVVRRIFDAAYRDGWTTADQSARLRFAKLQRPEPDPLVLTEVDAVLAWMGERHPTWRNYFELAFFTGLRTSELIALEWGDIDWRARTMTVQRARVMQETKTTKTATVRRIELNTRALAALHRQKAHTFVGGTHVFLHPATGRQINDDQPPRRVWNSALKALGLRHRDAYQTRHSYATICLMAGANPAWIARQLGHANLSMLLTHYARWIDRADGGAEIGKIESAIVEKS